MERSRGVFIIRLHQHKPLSPRVKGTLLLVSINQRMILTGHLASKKRDETDQNDVNSQLVSSFFHGTCSIMVEL